MGCYPTVAAIHDSRADPVRTRSASALASDQCRLRFGASPEPFSDARADVGWQAR